jgi:ankyrin repeat protein
MRWLLDLKGDPCALNADRMSPLACAVFKNCAGTTELLLLAEPSTLKLCDANGDQPLHLALLESSTTALQVLLNHGADWFERNQRGESSFDLYKTVLQAMDSQDEMQRLAQVTHTVAAHFDCDMIKSQKNHNFDHAADCRPKFALHRQLARQGHDLRLF